MGWRGWTKKGETGREMLSTSHKNLYSNMENRKLSLSQAPHDHETRDHRQALSVSISQKRERTRARFISFRSLSSMFGWHHQSFINFLHRDIFLKSSNSLHSRYLPLP